MDRLIAADAQDGCPQDFTCVGVHQNFHESFRLALFDGPRYFLHGARSDQRSPAALAYFNLGEAATTERRIDVHCLGQNAIADAPPLTTGEIGGNNLEIVIGRVSERAPSIAVAE